MGALIAACAVLMLSACSEEDPSDPGAEVVDPTQPSPAAEQAGQEAEADPLNAEPPFEFRRVRTEPGVHDGEPRLCDVGFVDEVHVLEPQEREIYPAGTAAHRAIRCEAATGGGWLEVVFDDTSDANQVQTARRVVLVPESEGAGRHGYVVARFVRALGDVPAPSEPAEPADEPTSPGFDFGRLTNEPALSRTPKTCVVDFVSEVELVEPRTRARAGYPPGTQNRLNVKCLHPDGDAWIDLVFDAEAAASALEVVPGRAIVVDVVRPSGGFADRPVVHLAEGT